MSLRNYYLSFFCLVPAVTTVAMSQATAQGEPQTTQSQEAVNSLNINPFGALAGSYSVNYERLLSGQHGLLLESTLAAQSDDESSSALLGVGVGYRFHFSGEQDSVFFGVNLGASVGSGSARIEEGNMTTEFDVDASLVSITANLGKRWAWDRFNITVRLGGGRGFYSITTESTDAQAATAVEKVDKLLTDFPIAIDGELSVGYMF